jgi:4-azaleucine resistance transporter AzlC
MHANRSSIRSGLVALFPLWPGIVSIGLAYAVVSRSAGLTAFQIVALSVMLYSGAAQFAFTALVNSHASAWGIIGTVALLNLRHILYGMAASRWLPTIGQPPRAVLAHCLVDESYGLTEAEVNRGRPSGWFLLGAGISLFTAWNIAVSLGLIISRFVSVPTDAGLDFIFPLSFVALTIPLLRTWHLRIAAICAGVTTIVVGTFAGSGLTIVAATIAVGFALEPADEQ